MNGNRHAGDEVLALSSDAARAGRFRLRSEEGIQLVVMAIALWQLIVGGPMFWALGTLLLVVAVYKLVTLAGARRLRFLRMREAHPDRPELWCGPWDGDGSMVPAQTARRTLVADWVFVVGAGVICVVAVFGVRTTPWASAATLLALGAVSICVGHWTSRWRRSLRLAVPSLSLVPGDRLRAALMVAEGAPVFTLEDVRIRVLHMSRGSETGKRKIDVLGEWQTLGTLPESLASGDEVELDLLLPHDQPASRFHPVEPLWWELRMEAKRHGRPREWYFLLPVFDA